MFQVVHYICEADELKRTDLCSHLASEPAVLFSKDDLTKNKLKQILCYEAYAEDAVLF